MIERALDYGIITMDGDGQVTSWNPGAERLFGWSEAEMVGHDSCIIFTPEDLAHNACLRELETARSNGQAEDERWHLRKDGSRFWASGMLIRLDEDGGRSLGFVKMVRDRTHHKLREERLRESEARLKLTMSAARMAIWEYEIEGDCLVLTPELIDYLEVPPEEATPAGVLARYHPGDRERVRSEIEAAIVAGRSGFEVEFRFRRGELQWRWLSLRGEILPNASGQPERVLGGVFDITRRKTMEETLRSLTDTLEEQVAQRTRELLKAEEALRQSQKMEAIGQLTGGVAHDFNNLLTIIRSAVDLLRRPDLKPERRGRYIEAISETVDRATKLTRQLLAFARRQALEPEVFDVAERTRGIADMVRAVVGARIKLEVGTDGEDLLVEADAGQFETAIVNLAVNARDAMDGEGAITIATRATSCLPRIRGHGGAEAPFVAISVTDTGSGIPADTLPHIFEPFFTTKEVGKGTGLGLSQVYGFAKQSGGDVEVKSDLGQGTTFTLFLPQVPADRRAPDAAAQEQVAGEGQRRILVVEDNLQVGEFATQLLQELGHVTTHAPNGAAALRVLEERAEQFDVVFTDVVMPGMSGVELAEEVRRRHPRLRVILTSGYSHVLAEEGTHGFDLLQKPYSVDGINRMLRGR